MKFKTITTFEIFGISEVFSIGDEVKLPEWLSVEHSETNVTRLYVGTPVHGIVAQYDASVDRWFPCWSNGNFGKNFSSGGTWYSPSRKECERFSTLKQAIDAKPFGNYIHKSEATRNRRWIKNYFFGD